jgi:hypothetical protein
LWKHHVNLLLHSNKFTWCFHKQNYYKFQICSVFFYTPCISILWKYTIIMDNQLINSISNKGPYNFHSMAFYGFSKFFPMLLIRAGAKTHPSCHFILGSYSTCNLGCDFTCFCRIANKNRGHVRFFKKRFGIWVRMWYITQLWLFDCWCGKLSVHYTFSHIRLLKWQSSTFGSRACFVYSVTYFVSHKRYI